MSGKYVFLVAFVCIDIAVLTVYLVLYLSRRGSSRPFPPVMWASYPLLIVLLVLVPLVIVFEDVLVAIILTATASALYVLALTARGYLGFAYPRGKRFRAGRHDYSFHDGDGEEKLPY
ncbi:MAG: hypothetical protein JW854_04110 [Actinobacteria bacterium]|nr:hypothetical protein [Actinomycetota bacterium]